MPPRDPITILLINDIGEEVKLVTISFRGFFAGCRVDVAYSLDEAIQWAPQTDWHLLLIDERLVLQRSTPILSELKRLAPNAVVVLQTDRSDAAAAINTLQAGADFLLYKKSPAFLTELMLYTKDAVEKRELRKTLERTQERHGRLVDTLADVLYELDAEGRFVFVSPSVETMLGYTPDELTGSPYSTVVPTDQLQRAHHRFNDRRTGARASRLVDIELVSKANAAGQAATRIRTEISAKGLYDSQRRFVGTLGLLRDVSKRYGLEATIRRLEDQLRERDRSADMARRLSTLSEHLQIPLAGVLSHSQQLLGVIQQARLDEHVTSLLQSATEAVRQGHVLSQTVQQAASAEYTINDILDTVLAAAQPPIFPSDAIDRQYAQDLPAFAGKRDVTIQLFDTLLRHAQGYLATLDRQHRLTISTAAIGWIRAPQNVNPNLTSAPSPVEISVRLAETDVMVPNQGSRLADPADVLHAYAIVQELGGRLEVLAPAGGLLSMTVWLPVNPPAGSADAPRPQPPTVPVPAMKPEVPSTATTGSRDVSAAEIEFTEPLKDRRRQPRATVHLPARITVGNTTRDGWVTNLSPQSAAVEVEGIFPSLEGQPAYIVLKTVVSMLELQATTRDRGVWRRPDNQTVVSRLAFLFGPTEEVEERILLSLIDETRDRTFSLTLEALLSIPDDSPDSPSYTVEPDQRGTDHREAIRVRMAIPARLESPLLHRSAQRPLALVVNLSRGGACLQMKQPPGVTGEIVFLHFSTTGSLGFPRTHEPEAPEAVLAARIVWAAVDPSAPSELKPTPSSPGQRIGVRFVHLTPFAEREISRVVAQHVGSPMDLEGIAVRSSIVSARRECRNARQQVIAITDEHARHQISPSTPVVILVPGFGHIQTDYLPLAFSLASHRLRVLRYDHTNHVGHSDGDVLQTTLRSMQVDLHNVLEFARSTWPTAPLTIIAEDVAARVALKVMAQHRDSALLLLVNPVLDLQTALVNTFRHDVVADYQQGLRTGIANVWGLNINLDQFISDALAGEYADLSTTVTDFSRLAALPIICTTPKQHDVTFGQLQPALRALAQMPLVRLKAELWVHSETIDERYSSTFQTIFKHIAATHELERNPIDSPQSSQRDIPRQQRLEHERLRIRHHVSQATRDALWIAHLAQLSQLDDLHESWLLREELYRHLGPLESGMTVLDIGCGQGSLAQMILTSQAYRQVHRSGPPELPPRYIGVDQSHESLRMADQKVQAYAQELTAALSAKLPEPRLLDIQWVQSNWDSPSPFREESVTQLLFHLSLAFCPSPLSAVRQAIQSLDADGTIVITCFQPTTDLSVLFRRHLRSLGQDEFAPGVQVVLHYLGRLREAIRHGLLHSYGRQALEQLLIHSGAIPIRSLPLADGQLLMAIARKANSAG